MKNPFNKIANGVRKIFGYAPKTNETKKPEIDFFNEMKAKKDSLQKKRKPSPQIIRLTPEQIQEKIYLNYKLKKYFIPASQQQLPEDWIEREDFRCWALNEKNAQRKYENFKRKWNEKNEVKRKREEGKSFRDVVNVNPLHAS